MPKVLNKRTELRTKPYAIGVYVGRPSKWGNPFEIGRDGAREEVIAKYRDYLMHNALLREEAQKELRGHDLICWYAPLACHADILLEIANGPHTAAE